MNRMRIKQLHLFQKKWNGIGPRRRQSECESLHNFNSNSNSIIKKSFATNIIIKKSFATNSNINSNTNSNINKNRIINRNSSNSNSNSNSNNGNNNRGRKQINVGQGENQNYNLIKSQGLNPAQQKGAQVQLQNMEQSTARILNMSPADIDFRNNNNSTSTSVDALANDVRVAIHFWSHKWIIHHHPFCTIYPTHVHSLQYLSNNNAHDSNDNQNQSYIDKEERCYGNHGPKQAERLLQWIIDVDNTHPNLHFFKKVLGKDSNVIITNIIDAYLLPCTTSSAAKWQFGQDRASASDNSNNNNNNNNNVQMNDFTQFSTATGSHNVNAAMWTPAIHDACRVIDTMNNLMMDTRTHTHTRTSERTNTNTVMTPDTNSDNAILYVWMKLAVLLDLDSSNHSVIQNIQVQRNAHEHIDNMGIHGSTGESIDGSGLALASLPSSMLTSSRKEVADAMEAKLLEMEERFYSTRDERVRPNVFSYNHVLRALILQGTGESTVDRVLWYLRRMEQTEDRALEKSQGTASNDGGGGGGDDDDDAGLPPTTAFVDAISYNLAIHAISSTIDHREVNSVLKLETARKADSLLLRAESRYKRIGRKEAQPTTITYSNVLKAWANASRAPEAEGVLNRMITLSEDTSGRTSDVKPNRICFNTVIDAWAKTKGLKSAENAVKILERMEELSETVGSKEMYPDTITYSSVISAFARSGRKDAGDRAEELLERSLRLYDKGNEDLKPDSMTFCSVLDALSKQSQYDREFPSRKPSADRARDAFERMREMHKSGDTSVRPNTVAFNILLGMYANLMQPKNAEKLFEEMCSLYEAGNSHVKPDAISYKNYLYSLANSSRRDDVDKALRLLRGNDLGHSFVPDVNSYIAVLKALAKQSQRDPNLLNDIEAILQSMEERFRSGQSAIKPINVCYNCYLDALSKSRASDAFTRITQVIRDMTRLSKEWDSPELLPDTFTYTSAMNALAHSQEEDRAGRGEDLLREMKNQALSPNRYTYNSFINCLAKSGRRDAAERAEEILLQMRELSNEDPSTRPDIYTFASVINCWANSNTEHSAERAERILNLVENRSTEGDEHLRPTLFTYGAVLNAWAKSRSSEASQRALLILHRIEGKYGQGDETMRPNGPIYNSVINAIAKSESSTKAAEAEAILYRMRNAFDDGNHDAKPNTRTLSTILNACAYSNGSESDKISAFKVARRIFKEILSGDSGNPNQIVFATFLKCCSLIPPGVKRDQLVQSIFTDCRERGLVDVKVIISLRRLLSSDVLQSLLGEPVLARGMVEIGDIPSGWRNNLHSRDLPQRSARKQPRNKAFSSGRKS